MAQGDKYCYPLGYSEFKSWFTTAVQIYLDMVESQSYSMS